MTKSAKATAQRESLEFLRSFGNSAGDIITMTIPPTEVATINRYRNSLSFTDIKHFVQQTVGYTIRWMQRMINGEEMFELDTMEHWVFNRQKNLLILRNPKKRHRDYEVIFDMEFTRGDIKQYHIGMSMILSSFWYKIHALPTAIVELIAACDLLYREHHGGRSPAADAGVQHVDISEHEAEQF